MSRHVGLAESRIRIGRVFDQQDESHPETPCSRVSPAWHIRIGDQPVGCNAQGRHEATEAALRILPRGEAIGREHLAMGETAAGSVAASRGKSLLPQSVAGAESGLRMLTPDAKAAILSRDVSLLANADQTSLLSVIADTDRLSGLAWR